MVKSSPRLPWWTWVMPFLIFQLSSGLSVELKASESLSLLYFPVPIAMVLVQWWGPRVLIGLYLSEILAAGYWGLTNWWLWPLYSMPTTLDVGLSWVLFTYFLKGKPWFPNLSNLSRYLFFGIVIPSGIASLYGTVQLVLFGDANWDHWMQRAYFDFVVKILRPFAITVPILLFVTPIMEKLQLSVTEGAYPSPPLFSKVNFDRFNVAEVLFLFAGIGAASFFISLSTHWFIYGIFLIWTALRFGIGLAALGTMWSIFLAVILPAFPFFHAPITWNSQADLVLANLNLATLCFASLVVGRALSDVFQEIEFRKQIEFDLKVGEQKYRTLFDSAFDALVIADNGIFIDCNDRALSLFGVKKEEFIGTSANRFYPPTLENGQDATKEMVLKRLSALEGKPQFFDWKLKKLNGEVFDTQMAFVGVSLNGKKVILSSIRDITDKKIMENNLSESEARFRQMAENIREIFFLIDCATEKTLYLSPLAEQLLDVPLEKIIENPLAIENYMEEEDRIRIGLSKDNAWKKIPFDVDFRFKKPDGNVLWLRLKSSIIRDAKGNIYRIAGVIADITEHRKAQEEARKHQQSLIQRDKMNSLGQMVSGVAHEINNPNNLIMLNSDVIETFWQHWKPVLNEHYLQNTEWAPSGIPFKRAEEKFGALISGVAGGSRRIKRIVANLKDFARLDSGDNSETVSIEKVIEAAVGIVDNLIQKSTDKFLVFSGEGIPNFQGNFQKLEQVVINLITNACQALPSRDKSISIYTWYDKDSDRVGLRIEDEGCGIPLELIQNVTDPFFTTKRDIGGTGLGLSVSYGIIKEHQGFLEIQSTENMGTKIEIRIPRFATKI